MIQTQILQTILKSAEEIRASFGDEILCASHIAAAASLFCNTEYTGLSPSDLTNRPAPFEEERLRYVFNERIRVKGHFVKILFNKGNREGLTDSFDLALCERIAAIRGAEILSSDVVFLCALKALKGNAKKFVFGVNSQEEILAALSEADRNIYDFVISGVDKIRLALEEKIKKAKLLRDWKPAEKIMEPEELAVSVFGTVEKTVSERSVVLKVPKFFGSSDLKLSVHQVGEIWYVHDNGCSVRHLKKHLENSDRLDRVLKKVCHSRLIDRGRIVGNFTTGYRFFFYLQKLIFIAHADLYDTRAVKQLYRKDAGEVYVPFDRAEKLDANLLFKELKQSIAFSYHEERGITVCPQTLFSLFSTRPSFLIETKKNGEIVLSDDRKGKVEGEIFEAFYWDHDDLSVYNRFMKKFATASVPNFPMVPFI